jgi:hypothetical protein
LARVVDPYSLIVGIRTKALSEIESGRVATGVTLLELLRGLKDRESASLLASLYDQGKYVLRDTKRSIELFTEAARRGLVYAE